MTASRAVTAAATTASGPRPSCSALASALTWTSSSEHQGHHAERADVGALHDLQGLLGWLAAAESVSQVGQTVQVQARVSAASTAIARTAASSDPA